MEKKPSQQQPGKQSPQKKAGEEGQRPSQEAGGGRKEQHSPQKPPQK